MKTEIKDIKINFAIIDFRTCPHYSSHLAGFTDTTHEAVIIEEGFNSYELAEERLLELLSDDRRSTCWRNKYIIVKIYWRQNV